MSTSVQKWLIAARTVIVLSMFGSCTAIWIDDNRHDAELCGPNGYETKQTIQDRDGERVGWDTVCLPKP